MLKLQAAGIPIISCQSDAKAASYLPIISSSGRGPGQVLGLAKGRPVPLSRSLWNNMMPDCARFDFSTGLCSSPRNRGLLAAAQVNAKCQVTS